MRDCLTKKRSSKVVSYFLRYVSKVESALILMILDCNNVDFLYNESVCGFVLRLCLQSFLKWR